MSNQTGKLTKCQPCWCIYISLAHWNFKTDCCCSLEGTLVIKSSLYLPFVVLPLDHCAAVRERSEQRKYEDTPVSTSSRSQAAVKLYCWHIRIMRNYKSYSKKNIFFLNIVKYSFKAFIKRHILKKCNPNGLNLTKITIWKCLILESVKQN